MTTKPRKSAQPRGKKKQPKDDPWASFPKLDPNHPLYSSGWHIGQKRSHTTKPPKPERPEGLHLFNMPSHWSLDEEWGGTDEDHPRALAAKERAEAEKTPKKQEGSS
jgi:hypothetical protein